jgi:hypothetical protein
VSPFDELRVTPYTGAVLQNLRERLTLLLLVLLPLHALFITVATKLIQGPGHAPLSWLAPWKEAVLGILLLIAVIELLKNIRSAIRIDLLDGFILALLIWSGLSTFVFSHANPSLFALGFRYDFVPLVAFLILRRVPWSNWFRSLLPKVLLWLGVVLAIYALLTFFLPLSYFVSLGYSDLHSLYLPDKPLAAFQQIENSWVRRVQGSFSGPNQLGLWMLIPLGVVWGMIARRDRLLVYSFTRYFLVGVLIAGALVLSFSRSAWIAAFLMSAGIFATFFAHKLSRKQILGGGVGVLAVVLIALTAFPHIFLRLSSTRGHLDKPLEALQMMTQHPLGLGLGTAGPASNRTSDACVMLREGDDPSWAKDRPDLCVFVGDTQVQPVGRACKCPVLTENWYLQLGVEMGWIGMLLFLGIVGIVLYRLKRAAAIMNDALPLAALLAFVALSIAGMFLHAWEDTAIAWTVWGMVAVVLRKQA